MARRLHNLARAVHGPISTLEAWSQEKGMAVARRSCIFAVHRGASIGACDLRRRDGEELSSRGDLTKNAETRVAPELRSGS